MEIKEINDKSLWESFLLGCKEKTFLNSWNWGEFQRRTEDKIWRLGAFDNDLKAAALVVKVKAKRGTFLFLPHCPVGDLGSLRFFVEKLKDMAFEERASFIRIAPIAERKKTEVFEKMGFLQAPIHMHPEVTWELDISLSEEEILKNMRKTTRYLIKQGKKNPDLKVVKSNDIEKFSDLLQKTAVRHHFVPFSLDYLKNQYLSFSPDKQIEIFLTEYKGEVIASAVAVFWQGTGFYHHGASLSKYNSNKVPASYLQQWEMIKEAKTRGCLKYNFWGIAESEDDKKHPWYGLTSFKKGFGGERKEYVKTQDFPIYRSYYLTRVFERLRKLKRRL